MPYYHRHASDPEAFVHRTGRTGRAGKDGLSIVLYGSEDEHDLRKFERHTKRTFPQFAVPSQGYEDLVDAHARPAINCRAPSHVFFF